MLRSLVTIALFSLAVVSAAHTDGHAARDREMTASGSEVDLEVDMDVDMDVSVDVNFGSEEDEDSWDDDSYDEGCPCEKHRREREIHPRVCKKIVNDRLPALRVTSPHISPAGPSFWETCTWQEISFDASGYPEFELAYVQLFGGNGYQVNLKPVKASNGVATFFVPKELNTGLYRARVILRRYCSEREPCQELAAIGPWFHIRHSKNNCLYNK